MPNPDPSPETRFQRGREKTGGRKKGTLNRPKSIKVAMREFTDEKGGELLNWAEALINGPNFVMVGDKVVNLTPVKVTLFRYALEYGIGTPNKQVKDGGHHTLRIVLRQPVGTDPVALRMEREAEADRRELQAGRALPARREIGPKAMSTLMKAANVLPRTVKDPQNPDVDLVPVTDSDFPDDPSLDVHSEDVTR